MNDQGEGTVTLPIGDFNGELRVMAAWTADDFGSSEDKVVVAAPVIAELNTPRFLASGDTTRLALDLSNLTDKPQTLQVHLTASGLVTLSEGQLPPVQLAPGARSTLFIPVSALAGFGDGQVNATISGLSLPGETFAPLQNSGKSACVRRTRHRPSTAAQCCSGESWQPPAAQSGFARKRCRANCCSAVNHR